MQKTHNTLPQDIRIRSVELLNLHLAAAIDLRAQLKQAHWNVRSPGFIAIHELFDRVSTEVEQFSDMLAERAGGLGGTTNGTIQTAAKFSYLIPYPLGIADALKHLFAVSVALQHLARLSAVRSKNRRLSAMLRQPICSPKSRAG